LSHHTRAFTSPKNDKVRTVTVISPALEPVAELPVPLDRSRELFRTKKDRLFKGNSFNYYWSPIRAAFGRPDLDYYELQHFYGSHLLNTLELPAQDVAQQLGSHRQRHARPEAVRAPVVGPRAQADQARGKAARRGNDERKSPKGVPGGVRIAVIEPSLGLSNQYRPLKARIRRPFSSSRGP
jgi:hypothetical protein